MPGVRFSELNCSDTIIIKDRIPFRKGYSSGICRLPFRNRIPALKHSGLHRESLIVELKTEGRIRVTDQSGAE